jgi:hypothetical protein
MNKLFAVSALLMAITAQPQTANNSGAWQAANAGFRPLAITSAHGAFWVAGVGGVIASSVDGQHWEIRNQKVDGAATLVGIEFSSESFGYAYGTGGTLLTTDDGGKTWNPHHLLDENILLASLSDDNHGLFRTSQNLYYLDGSGSPKIVSEPAETLKRFSHTPFLVSLTPSKMGVLLSEGPYSEAGFLTTTDGGKTWTFYGPPSTGVASFLRVDGKYWATGHEVVGKDKPGGGSSVPLAMSSDDGLHWEHTSNEIHPCHWEICSICTTEGCLASSTLLANFFHGPTAFSAIPEGSLSAKWAANQDRICTLHQGINCASLSKALNAEAMPPSPKPTEQSIPPLGTKIPADGVLRCMPCSLEPVYIDDKAKGEFKLHIRFQVSTDGTVETVTVEKAPSDSLQQKVQAQIADWLFEPPKKMAKPSE